MIRLIIFRYDTIAYKSGMPGEKYGIPPGMSEEDVAEMREEIDALFKTLYGSLIYPKDRLEVEEFARKAGRIYPGDLDRPFTI